MIYYSGSVWDNISASNPSTSVNPDKIYVNWLNTTTLESFICVDNAVGANVWKGNQGTIVS